MKSCGKCGKEGHNARTCKANRAAKKGPAPSAPPTQTVTESLQARQKQLQRELAVIGRVLAELETLEVS
jgi:hypothetical protein